MTPIERKLLRQSAMIGSGLTLLVVAMAELGGLSTFEFLLHDRRARNCQFFGPAPTDRLIHLDITDESLDKGGPWPWPRTQLGAIIDELRIAGAKAIALDVIFQEPKPEEDTHFAEALERHGRVLVPAYLRARVKQAVTPRFKALHALLNKNLELSEHEAADAIQNMGIKATKEDPKFIDQYLTARRMAMESHVKEQMERDFENIEDAEDVKDVEDVDYIDKLRSILLPKTNPDLKSGARRTLESVYRKAKSRLRLRRFAIPVPEGLPSALPMDAPYPPVLTITDKAAASGFVDFLPGGDGVLRSIPLWAEHDGRLYPQLGLSLACVMLDVELKDLTLHRDHVVVPLGDGRRSVIPVYNKRIKQIDHPVGMVSDILMFGEREQWMTMYGPQEQTHVPLIRIWAVLQTRKRIRSNCELIDTAIMAIYELMDPEKLSQMEDNRLPLDDVASRLPFIDEVLAEAKPWVEILAQPEQEVQEKEPDEKSDTREKIFIESTGNLPILRRETTKLAAQLHDELASLRKLFNGRAVLFGSTATGAADLTTTSLHASCPGVVIHGVVFNSIMSNDHLRRAPQWQSTAAIVIMGIVGTSVAALFAPFYALVISISLGLVYCVFNGVVLYDYANTIIDAAGPTTVIILVWSGTTLARFIVERRERARITRRFSSYVDPALVNYVIENPDRARLDGELRELTVVFTDLSGFTTLSERLKERTVPLLNDYMGRMVEIIRRHNGYVNKFLGDGIMFFYGAPRENVMHADDAVKTVIEMQEAMIPFNEDLKRDDLPTVSMRAGAATGKMVVGDAGSEDASDYTVLGDIVNLSARLESANKATGSQSMINERTAELVGDAFLLRPIARLQVVGKTQSVMVFEPICATPQASEEQRQLVEMAWNVIRPYVDTRFVDCLKAIDEFEQAHGPSKLYAMYRDQCRQHLETPPTNGFDGQIVLASK